MKQEAALPRAAIWPLIPCDCLPYIKQERWMKIHPGLCQKTLSRMFGDYHDAPILSYKTNCNIICVFMSCWKHSSRKQLFHSFWVTLHLIITHLWLLGWMISLGMRITHWRQTASEKTKGSTSIPANKKLELILDCQTLPTTHCVSSHMINVSRQLLQH